jgi:hypothetical protein
MLNATLRWVLALALFVSLGCAALRPAPVVRNRTFRIPEGSLERVAVLPFLLKPSVEQYAAARGDSAGTAADLVGRFVTEQLQKRRMSVVPPSDVATALSARGSSASADTKAMAELAAEDFGATAVLVGRVNRYRERGGEKYGATSGASVAFELSLYTAPGAQRIWMSSFDETQRALGDNIWNAQRYPGGGTRWLTAAELATWGAESSIDSLPNAK